MNFFLGAVNTFEYNSMVWFLFLLTLNRFCIFIWRSMDGVVFRRPRIFVPIVAVWIFGLFITVISNATGCLKTFNAQGIAHS
jgi:hypothetical protein